jgi:N-acetylmuramic acid 6-phosphate etherase
MVDMQLTNDKLVDRGTLMIQEALSIPYDDAAKLLGEFGSVRNAINANTNK